jgi:hypothetical protein
MSSAPVLTLPNFSIPFTLETDASQAGIGHVLMQNGQPIAYYSQALGPNASAQSTYHKEALAILLALKRWRHYLIGGQLIIKTDQQSLKYMENQRLIEGIQHKLMMKLLEFNYRIEYKKGKENLVVDALSRKDYSLSAISMAVPAWISDIEASYKDDAYFTNLVQQLVVNANSVLDFAIYSSTIRYKGRIYIGQSTDLKQKIVASLHSSVMNGHSGIKATYQRIKIIFYWPNLRKTVEEFVTQCHIYQRAKAEHCHYPRLLVPLPIPNQAWTHVSMDFIEGLPKSGKHNVILVVVDKLTKYSHFIPLSHSYTTQTITQLFLDHTIKLECPPLTIVIDRDRILTSKLWQDIFQSLKVSLHYSSAYHP